MSWWHTIISSIYSNHQFTTSHCVTHISSHHSSLITVVHITTHCCAISDWSHHPSSSLSGHSSYYYCVYWIIDFSLGNSDCHTILHLYNHHFSPLSSAIKQSQSSADYPIKQSINFPQSIQCISVSHPLFKKIGSTRDRDTTKQGLTMNINEHINIYNKHSHSQEALTDKSRSALSTTMIRRLVSHPQLMEQVHRHHHPPSLLSSLFSSLSFVSCHSMGWAAACQSHSLESDTLTDRHITSQRQVSTQIHRAETDDIFAASSFS